MAEILSECSRLVDGTTITKIPDAVGINANWLKTGRIEIMDDDGNVILEADIDKEVCFYESG
ncbi:MAG: hypothetical protein ACLTER_20635 [Ruminococcus sp.]